MKKEKDYFDASITVEGKQYDVRIFPDYEEGGNTFYQCFFTDDGTEKIFFLELSNDLVPKWKLKEGDVIQPRLTEEFIYKLGNKIESIED